MIGRDAGCAGDRDVATAHRFSDPDSAVAGIRDGATVLIGGVRHGGLPVELIDAVRRAELVISWRSTETTCSSQDAPPSARRSTLT